MFNFLLNLFKFLYNTRYFHYGIIGVLGSGFNLGSTYILTEWIHWYYMASYAMATLFSWIVVFFLHSHITFRGHNKERQHKRFLKFITVYGTALAINSALVYFLTETVHIYYLFSIVIVTLVLSVGTFLVNKKSVFYKKD